MNEQTMVLLLVLIVAAVLVTFLLIYGRTTRFEGYLKEIQGLRNLNERIRSLNEAMERLDTSTMEEHLFDLRQKVSRLVVLLEERQEENRVSSKNDARSALETVLFSMGFEKISVMGDLDRAAGADPVDVQVECVKAEVRHKGTVTMQAGSVVAVRMRPAYEVFP